jgi:hypothetical protein
VYKGYALERVKWVCPLVLDMTGDYPNDWSEDDIAAAEVDTPSWQESDTKLSDEDKEALQSQLKTRKAKATGGETKMYREKHQAGDSNDEDPDI